MKTLASTTCFLLRLLTLGLLCAGVSLAQAPAKPNRVMLKGFDPVAYFTDNKAVKGAPDLSYDFDDGRYLFANARHRQAFSKNPDQYAPQFAGFCTAGLAMGMKAESNPEIFMIVNGKLYTFSSVKAREAARSDPALLVQAEKAWQEKK